MLGRDQGRIWDSNEVSSCGTARDTEPGEVLTGGGVWKGEGGTKLTKMVGSTAF